MAIHKVALLGADGKLGPAILHALLAANFPTTVLKRASSKSADAYPSGTTVSKVPDDFPLDALTDALRGHDALIVTIKGTQTDLQLRLGEACVRAGVQRFVPADFGSCDSASSRTQDVVPLYRHKTQLREQLMRLAAEHQGAFTWSSIVCGHFFDWDPAFLHLWPRERRAEILGDGSVKWSASTLSRVADATVRILQRPEETANRVMFVQSFLVSQNEVLAAYERATGGEGSWEVVRHDAAEYERAEKGKADAGDLEAVENLVWVLGVEDGDWTRKEGFAMDVLGLQDESLAEVVARVVRQSQ